MCKRRFLDIDILGPTCQLSLGQERSGEQHRKKYYLPFLTQVFHRWWCETCIIQQQCRLKVCDILKACVSYSDPSYIFSGVKTSQPPTSTPVRNIMLLLLSLLSVPLFVRFARRARVKLAVCTTCLNWAHIGATAPGSTSSSPATTRSGRPSLSSLPAAAAGPAASHVTAMTSLMTSRSCTSAVCSAATRKTNTTSDSIPPECPAALCRPINRLSRCDHSSRPRLNGNYRGMYYRPASIRDGHAAKAVFRRYLSHFCSHFKNNPTIEFSEFFHTGEDGRNEFLQRKLHIYLFYLLTYLLTTVI